MTIVTPPVAANTLLALVGALTPVGYQTFGGSQRFDYANDIGYHFEQITTTTGVPGVKKFTVGTSGAEAQQATETQIFGAGPADTLTGADPCYHPSGVFVCNVNGISNSTPLSVIDATTLVVKFVVGKSSSSLDPSTNDDGGQPRYVNSVQMVALTAGDSNYVVSQGLSVAGASSEVGIFRIDPATLFVVYAQDIAQETAKVCAGNNGTTVSVASFYVLGDKFARGTGDSTPVVLYEFLVHGATVGARTIRSVAPADIDATWTTFFSVSDPGYDLHTGYMLAFFKTGDAVTNKHYLVAFDPVDGSVVWKAIVTNETSLPHSNINGTVGVFNQPLGGPNSISLIDTTNGGITTQLWNNGLSFGIASWDYLSGSLSGSLSYSAGSGPIPTYVGGYLSGHSNVIPNNYGHGRIFTGQPYVVPANPNPPSGSAPQTSWTYFLDGHQFYVIDLGAQGTFLFDQLTDQWCKFVTTSTTPLWNMAVGTMWNSRVVGGDRTLNKVWELDPNATLDNGADAIVRAVTGMIQRRSRNYMGVGALRVVCSSGSLDGTGDGTITLRFSDDLEHTWSDPFTLTLTAGDFNQEVAWRALGSFAAPGRVFELQDSGGLVRIDGADLDPEKDEDEQPTS